jgi:hypothetical protein
VTEFTLQMAIGFFITQVAAWAGLCLYLRATHQRRAADRAIADISDDVTAQAA